MVRLIGFFVGIGFAFVALFAFVVGAFTWATEGTPDEGAAYAFYEEPVHANLPSDGVFGRFDTAQLQRGFQVYKEVCAACHGLSFVAFRSLGEIGYNEAQIKNIASEFQVPGVDPNTGEANSRPGTPTDYFPDPYPNDIAAAAANGNAIPPDLSLITKARHHGTDYLYSLLTGYSGVPQELRAEYPDFETPDGLYFNRYFPNLNIAMAPPLTMDGQVSYAPGNPEPTIQQMSLDVAAFLTWTAEPKLAQRLQTGWPIMGFLLLATILAYLAKQQIWAKVKPKHRKQGPLQGSGDRDEA